MAVAPRKHFFLLTDADHTMENESPAWADEPQFWSVVPVIATTDVQKTAEYYRDVLVFKIDDTFSGPEWTMLWADQCQLYLSLNPSAAATAHGQQIAICVPGVDDLYDEHRANGASIVSELEDKPWGLREYTVRDPNGYLLRFGSHIETQYKPWKMWKDQQAE